MMKKVWNNIWIGSWRAPYNRTALAKEGITSILNVAREHADSLERDPEIKYYKVGLSDDDKNSEKQKQKAVDTLMKLLDAKEKVLVHCAAGQSRSVWVVSNAVADREDMHANDVFEKIKSLQPFAVKGGLWKNEWKKYYKDAVDN